jgi:transposase
MSHYCGIDLHSNNHVVVVIDDEDKRVLEKRLNNDLSLTLKALSPYQDTLHGVAVESTFNWYWLVDGLQEQGYDLRLVNTAAVQQYDGLKYSDDHHDAFHLAHLMRLGILPTGYIYPKAQRAVRDLLRRRLFLVRTASAQLISVSRGTHASDTISRGHTLRDRRRLMADPWISGRSGNGLPAMRTASVLDSFTVGSISPILCTALPAPGDGAGSAWVIEKLRVCQPWQSPG